MLSQGGGQAESAILQAPGKYAPDKAIERLTSSPYF